MVAVVSAIDQQKQRSRERVWARLENEGAVEPGVHGRIPAFRGADEAAARVAALPAWGPASVIKAVPDRAQLPVRVRALNAGKVVYMAVPNLAKPEPFYLLDPARLSGPFETVASGKGAARVAPTVGLEDLRPVDLVVCGSVAVNRSGARLGKGAGYSDIEVALLHEAGLIGAGTLIITTVHSLQVIDGPIPETSHDFSVDLIVTPDEVIACGPPRRPAGLVWDDLDESKIAAIPVLAARMPR